MTLKIKYDQFPEMLYTKLGLELEMPGSTVRQVAYCAIESGVRDKKQLTWSTK